MRKARSQIHNDMRFLIGMAVVLIGVVIAGYLNKDSLLRTSVQDDTVVAPCAILSKGQRIELGDYYSIEVTSSRNSRRAVYRLTAETGGQVRFYPSEVLPISETLARFEMCKKSKS